MGRVGRFGGVLISEPGVGIRCRWAGQHTGDEFALLLKGPMILGPFLRPWKEDIWFLR